MPTPRTATEPELTPLQIATRRHRDEDMLLAGTYGRMNGAWRGCSVGCLVHDLRPDWDNDTIEDDGHALVAATYGYPEWLVYRQDHLFEDLPEADRAGWHVELANAIAEREQNPRKRDWWLIEHAVRVAERAIFNYARKRIKGTRSQRLRDALIAEIVREV